MSCLGSTKAQLATFDSWRGKTWPWPVSEATGRPEESAAPSLARSVAGRPGKEELLGFLLLEKRSIFSRETVIQRWRDAKADASGPSQRRKHFGMNRTEREDIPMVKTDSKEDPLQLRSHSTAGTTYASLRPEAGRAFADSAGCKARQGALFLPTGRGRSQSLQPSSSPAGSGPGCVWNSHLPPFTSCELASPPAGRGTHRHRSQRRCSRPGSGTSLW